MMSMSIHDIKEIKFEKLKHLTTDDGISFYSRHLIIKTDKGETIDIALFNDVTGDVLRVSR